MTAPLVLTPGEPAGIGPEITVRWLLENPGAEVVVVAARAVMERAAAELGAELEFIPAGRSPGADRVPIEDLPIATLPPPGKPDPANAHYLVATVDQAVAGCLDGRYSALVTAPVNKAVINAGGVPFSGHTERLAQQTGADQVVMLLVAGSLRVALVTTHLPLRDVPAAITGERLEKTLRILHGDLVARFGLASPRIAVCGLNPHAGEAGLLGSEEIDIIAPVCERFRSEGWALAGPLPADTVFVPRQADRFDAILAMYHDQGLPALKRAGFGQAVNVTLGLPIIRTSVDHGTALDIAGRGIADAASLAAACALARQLVARGGGHGPAS